MRSVVKVYSLQVSVCPCMQYTIFTIFGFKYYEFYTALAWNINTYFDLKGIQIILFLMIMEI